MERFMQRALDLAQRYRGVTSPNPMVGAVVVKDGHIVGEGAHPHAGMPHAEIFALRSAGKAANGATLYVTLEPCNHQGKTPPCTEAIIAAGITRVVAAMEDPNPLVQGKGFARLRQSGIMVECGMLEAQARKLNEVFIHYITTGMPFVTMKAATSLDGRIATQTGDSRWISSPSARRRVHEMRREYDAVMIGKGTLLKDNPRLNVRLDEELEGPQKIVIMPNLNVSARELTKMNVYRTSLRKPLIVVCNQGVAHRDAASRYAAHNIQLIPVEEVDGMINLRSLGRALGQSGITSLLLEGGAGLFTSYLQQQLINKITLFLGPIIIGAEGMSLVGHCQNAVIHDALRLKEITTKSFGDTVQITGYPTYRMHPVQKENQNSREDSCLPES